MLIKKSIIASSLMFLRFVDTVMIVISVRRKSIEANYCLALSLLQRKRFPEESLFILDSSSI